MQTKILNRIAIVIGILFAITCLLTPQDTLNDYEPIILLCFAFPYMLLVIWAMLRTEKDKEKKPNE
jgi:Sec-independent protein secretion pathway component TatC